MAGSDDAVAALRELILAGATYRVAVAARRGIGVRETEVIGYLLVRGSMRPNDLADALKVSAGTITNLVDRLSAQDFVTREPAPNDRRATLIVLTPQAVAFARDSWAELATCFDRTPGAGSDESVRILNGLARAVRERSEAIRDSGFSATS